jgi:hypothetical protein
MTGLPSNTPTDYPNGIAVGDDVVIREGSGVPTNGGSGTLAGVAGKGSLYLDRTNGTLYQNTNTKASPTWGNIPNTGNTANEVLAYNGSGSPMTAGQLVYVSGYNVANDCFQVALADADAGGKPAEWVLTEDIADTETGLVAKRWETPANVNTNSYTSVGDAGYLSATAGATTNTAPTAANALQQRVARVKVKSASVGVLVYDIDGAVKIGSNELEDASVLAAALGVTAGAITASRALVADANGNVAAFKTTNLLIGASGSEKAQAGDCSFSVAAEGSHAIVTTVQVKDFAAANLAQAINVDAWISDAAGGIGTTVDPTSNTAIGGSGAVLTETGGLTHFTKLKVTTGATGAFTVTTTQTAAQNYYLNVRLPNGVVKSSAVIAHAG